MDLLAFFTLLRHFQVHGPAPYFPKQALHMLFFYGSMRKQYFAGNGSEGLGEVIVFQKFGDDFIFILFQWTVHFELLVSRNQAVPYFKNNDASCPSDAGHRDEILRLLFAAQIHPLPLLHAFQIPDLIA